MAVTDGDPRFSSAPKAAKPNLLYRKEFREAVYQLLLVLFLTWGLYEIITNTAANLRQRNIASGFGFLDTTAGFDISQVWFGYTNTSTYFRAFWVGVMNTVVVAVVGIVLATIIGFAMGIARLSSNWLIAKIATVYIEIVRNLPLLLQLFFWYAVVLAALPAPRNSINLADTFFLNNRGLNIPKADWLPGSELVFAAVALAIVGVVVTMIWGNKRQLATGKRPPVLWISLALLIGLPLLAFLAAGRPVKFEVAELGRFNLTGGATLVPEYVALTLGLAVYTGAFIAEIVRAGILGVPKGQSEAARAIGLSSGETLRLVIVPQASRIIIPPLTSQFLNLTKNSSLAVAIGYQELFSVAGTINNQTGQAVEAVAMMMGVYLTLSLATSAFMNWFNKRMALVER
jgi:general L-amino acid transport system permease protein